MVDWTYPLAGLNGVLYVALALQLLRVRRGERPIESIGEAFAQLGEEVRRAIPALPRGFTWEEVVKEASKLKLEVNWAKVTAAVASYERYRYGGGEEPREGYEEIGALARELRRSR